MYRSDELRHIVQEKINKNKIEYMVFKIIDNYSGDSFSKNIGIVRVDVNYISSSNLDKIIRDEFYKMRKTDISDSNRYIISYNDVTREVDEFSYYINLDDYVWDDEFKSFVFNIKLNTDIEESVSTMKEVYDEGLNVGHCGLTSRYLAINDFEVELPFKNSKCNLLKGTAGSDYGNHCWCFKGDYIIDTTLMIRIPGDIAIKLGYSWDGILYHDSSRVLSENDTYSREKIKRKKLILR